MKRFVKSWLVCVLSLVLILAVVLPVRAAEDEIAQCADLSEAACVLREKLQQRQDVIKISVPYDGEEQSLTAQVMNAALVHTGVPNAGDYLRWSIRKCTAEQQILEQDGQSMLLLSYTATYYTTAQQEAQLDTAVKALLDQLDVYDAQTYEKISAVYDYICQNVTYDTLGALMSDKLVYSAYAALVQKRAVCQGYATLFYRLMLELGVDARLIAGTSKNVSHGWNIVRLDGKFYYVDATWDAQCAQGNKPYENFLKGGASFADHTPKETYTTDAFRRVYYMAEADHSQIQPAQEGDLTGDGSVTADDAIYLLQNVLMPELFTVEQAVDYTKDSTISVEDAIHLLQHVLMPELFPL